MLYHANSHLFDVQASCSWSVAQLELFQQVSNRRLALSSMLHGADISNACKPWTVCQSWADLVLREFFLQGDKERQLGIPVQMLNNRGVVKKPSSQVAFIELFVYPFNTAQVRLFPALWELSHNLRNNLQKWQALRTIEEQEDTGVKIQTICQELLVVIEAARALPAGSAGMHLQNASNVIQEADNRVIGPPLPPSTSHDLETCRTGNSCTVRTSRAHDWVLAKEHSTTIERVGGRSGNTCDPIQIMHRHSFAAEAATPVSVSREVVVEAAITEVSHPNAVPTGHLCENLLA